MPVTRDDVARLRENDPRTPLAEAPQTEATEWLTGTPMDPSATTVEPLPALPGFPFMHAGSSAVIVGPTGGGRSSLIEACLYDAAMGGLRCAYLGHEVTEDEFNARAAVLCQRRGDKLTAAVKRRLSAVRYLDLTSTIVRAWSDPEAWIEGVVERYDVLAIDPLSAVDSALDLDFDKANREFVTFYDGLVLPLTARGVAVPMVDNVGHAEDAKRRAKGVSAKGDKPDLTFACSLRSHPSSALAIRADKVRSVRASHKRGDEWLFDEATMRIERIERGEVGAPSAFRPTNIMQKLSGAVERDPGLSKTAIRTALGGNAKMVDLALELLVSEGYIERRKEGPQKLAHHSIRPYKEATESTESEPSPNQVSDSVPTTESDRVLYPEGIGLGDGLGSGDEDSAQPSPLFPDPPPAPAAGRGLAAAVDAGGASGAVGDGTLVEQARRKYGSGGR